MNCLENVFFDYSLHNCQSSDIEKSVCSFFVCLLSIYICSVSIYWVTFTSCSTVIMTLTYHIRTWGLVIYWNVNEFLDNLPFNSVCYSHHTVLIILVNCSVCCFLVLFYWPVITVVPVLYYSAKKTYANEVELFWHFHLFE